MSLISVQDVTVRFGSLEALSNVSFEVKAGEFVGLIGPNGAGKTTLLRVLLGLEQVSSGKVSVPSVNKIGYVSQKMVLDNSRFAISVKEILAMGCRRRSFFTPRSVKAKMVSKLELVGLLPDILYARFHNLSGGQKQRVVIARALMCDPKLLLFDEPTTGVDHPAKIRLYETLADLNKQAKTTILFVSHEVESIIMHCSRVLCLNKTLHEGCHPMDVFKEAAKECKIDKEDLLSPVHHHHPRSK